MFLSLQYTTQCLRFSISWRRREETSPSSLSWPSNAAQDSASIPFLLKEVWKGMAALSCAALKRLKRQDNELVLDSLRRFQLTEKRRDWVVYFDDQNISLATEFIIDFGPWGSRSSSLSYTVNNGDRAFWSVLLVSWAIYQSRLWSDLSFSYNDRIGHFLSFLLLTYLLTYLSLRHLATSVTLVGTISCYCPNWYIKNIGINSEQAFFVIIILSSCLSLNNVTSIFV